MAVLTCPARCDALPASCAARRPAPGEDECDGAVQRGGERGRSAVRPPPAWSCPSGARRPWPDRELDRPARDGAPVEWCEPHACHVVASRAEDPYAVSARRRARVPGCTLCVDGCDFCRPASRSSLGGGHVRAGGVSLPPLKSTVLSRFRKATIRYSRGTQPVLARAYFLLNIRYIVATKYLRLRASRSKPLRFRGTAHVCASAPPRVCGRC